MKSITIIVFDTINLSVKKAKIEQKDLVAFVNKLESGQIMLVKGGAIEEIFIRDKKVRAFVESSSIRSAIESL
ncbi:MAG: hypothetical protein IJ890_05700 [Clostridia bacterium]|nr:hypothetical protein [Clostridia bacterium]